jgi:hypothetical protein
LHLGLTAELSFGADLFRDAGDLGRERAELVDHRVDRVLQREDFAARFDGDLLREVSVGDGGGDLRDVAHLVGQVAREDVHVVCEVLPGSTHAFHFGLASELPFGADLFRDAGHFTRERPQLIDHRVDRVFELQNLAADVDGDLLGEVSVRDGGGDLRDVSHLVCEVAGEDVHVVGEVFPGSTHTLHLGLASELPFGADLFRDAGDLAREGAELVDHRVDGVLQLVDFALRVDADLA